MNHKALRVSTLQVVYAEAANGYGNALLTKLDIRKLESLVVSEPTHAEPRNLLIAQLTRQGSAVDEALTLGVTHLENTK